MNLYRACFQELKRQLVDKGFELKTGKIIDARLVKAARRPGADAPYASFAKKGDKTVYDYKDHIAVAPKHEFITEFVSTPANIYDSQIADELLEGNEAAVFANKAYDSRALKAWCRRKGVFYGVLSKAARNWKFTSSQRKQSKRLGDIRRKVEKFFEIFRLHLSRARARYVGLTANEIHFFLTTFTYNLLRLLWYLRR